MSSGSVTLPVISGVSIDQNTVGVQAGDSPSNAAVVQGWIKITIGGADAWLPFYR